jgi:hypothetical protein
MSRTCIHPDFRLPAKGTIKGRSSSITAAFFTAITPVVCPTDAEVEKALKILGMSRGRCVCAYCGDAKSEWDHFRPIVVGKLPTGFISEIGNLVPSCGKCNQAKGSQYWKDWMLSSAPRSPKSRRIRDLAQRVKRLEAYEKWRSPIRLDYAAIVGDKAWSKHLLNYEGLLVAMLEAQAHVLTLVPVINAHFQQQISERAL